LVGKLVSKNPEDQLTGGTAGRLLAEFEEPGFLALEPLTRHENIEVRQRALVGVMDLAHLAKDKVLKTKACKLLECCLEKETDARLHQWLVGCMAVACNKKSRESENPFEQHNP
jgi:hypothetical protein